MIHACVRGSSSSSSSSDGLVALIKGKRQTIVDVKGQGTSSRRAVYKSFWDRWVPLCRTAAYTTAIATVIKLRHIANSPAYAKPRRQNCHAARIFPVPLMSSSVLRPDAAEYQDETLPQQGRQETQQQQQQQQQAPTQKKAKQKPLWRGGPGTVFPNPQPDPVRPSYLCKNPLKPGFPRLT
jgi:hypothetical protein